MTKATKRAALACAVAAALGLALYFNGSTAADGLPIIR